jgi:hypothetical protein
MSTKMKEPKLLSGGNPQIPKGEDEAQLTDWVKQAAALPGSMP